MGELAIAFDMGAHNSFNGSYSSSLFGSECMRVIWETDVKDGKIVKGIRNVLEALQD